MRRSKEENVVLAWLNTLAFIVFCMVAIRDVPSDTDGLGWLLVLAAVASWNLVFAVVYLSRACRSNP